MAYGIGTSNELSASWGVEGSDVCSVFDRAGSLQFHVGSNLIRGSTEVAV